MTLTDLKNRKMESGFTIVELLIVIVVIAILAALVLTAYNGVQQRARDSSRQSDVRSVATATEALASESAGTYPTLDTLDNNAGTVKMDATVVSKLKSTAPSSTAKDDYQYVLCTGAGIDGAKIRWYKEETGTVEVRNLGEATGTGATC